MAAPQPEVTRQEAPRFTLQPFWADMLRDKGDRCVECLRYYYGCYPLTASSRDRALKLIATLRNLQADLHSLRDDMRKAASEGAEGSKLAEAVMRKVQPLLGLLAAAFSKYEEAGGY